MTTQIKRKTSKRKTNDEDLSYDVFCEAIDYINYISTIDTFDSIDVLPPVKMTVKKKNTNKKVKFEDQVINGSSIFESENVDKDQNPKLIRRVSGRKAAAVALAAIKESTLNIINQESEQISVTKAEVRQIKLESIKFDCCKNLNNRVSPSISAELKEINDTSNYARIAMEICKVLFTEDELKKGYFYDETDGPILPNKFNLNSEITLLLKNTIKVKLGLSDNAMIEAWKTLRKELNLILLKNQDDHLL